VLFREFAGLSWDTALPDETTILRFRRLLEQHKLAPQILGVVNDLLRDKGLMLRRGTVVDATLIAAPSSTKNASGERDPQMKQSKKAIQWYFGMKAHIGVDAESGLVHSVQGTTGSTSDVVQANSLLHSDETEAWGDAGYQGAEKRPDARKGVRWNIAMRPGKRRQLGVDQKHRTAAHDVRAVQSVDGAPLFDGIDGMSASAVGIHARCGSGLPFAKPQSSRRTSLEHAPACRFSSKSR
jgi:IS5 family transposase